MKITITALLLSLAAGSVQASGFDETQCSIVGEAYYRLADLRDNRADRAYAIHSVTLFMNGKDRTGSHLAAKDHRKLVAIYYDYIAARKDMDKGLMLVHGINLCLKSKAAQTDQELESYGRELDAVTRRCMTQFPQTAQRRSMGTCIEQGLQTTPAQSAANP